MCHAPIVIPAVAGSRAMQCQKSTQAMREAAQFIVQMNPEVLLLLSPHTPRFSNAFGLLQPGDHGDGSDGTFLQGHLGQFGHSEIKLKFSFADAEANLLCGLASESAVPLRRHEKKMQVARGVSIDHGALVPLFFLQDAGWEGPTLIMGFPGDASSEMNIKMGNLLQKFVIQSGKDWAFIASGDMSHRLLPEAPAGFHPEAHLFDQEFVSQVSCGNFRGATQIDERLRELAAEDVVDSLEVVSTVLGDQKPSVHVFSYEGPFGVGYFVAKLSD